jgi:hypothetical protein
VAVCHCAHGQQRSSHNLFWFRLNLSDTINKRIKWEALIQRRTQNSSESKAGLFDTPQFESYWLWVNYSLNKNVKVAFSPFGYFESYVLNVKPSDESLPPIKEFRWAARLDHETKGKYFNYINRYNLEYRRRDLLNNNDYQPNWRVRYMVRFEKPVNNLLPKPITFILYDEAFIQFGKAVRNNPNVFDQNRLYGGFSYEVLRNVKTTVGYIYGYQERNSGQDFDHINTFWVILNFDNVFSQFF